MKYTHTYACQALDPSGRIVFSANTRLVISSKFFFFKVGASKWRLKSSSFSDPPRITLDPPFQVVRPGEDATILCTATGDAPIQIQWAKLGQPYLPRSVISRGGRLEFRGISSEDQGRYTCSARNQVGSFDATAEVVVSSKWFIFLHLSSLCTKTFWIYYLKIDNTKGEWVK